MKNFIGILLVLCAVFAPGFVLAADEPSMPPPLKTLVDEGAQARYLGRQYGLDGWITIRNGQEQYFYVTEDGQALLMGVLFDHDGKLITARQVKALQDKGAGVLEALTVPTPDDTMKIGSQAARESATAFKTPAEQLYDNIEHANWIKLGKDGAPVIYSFMDPQCPHCHAFMQDLKANYIDNGLVQVRMIPVGIRPETRAQAAFLLASPDPEERWYKHLKGDKDALPVAKDVNEQGVERNMAIMQSWKLDATPLTIYRDSNGRVKIVQGRPQNVAEIIRDVSSKAR